MNARVIGTVTVPWIAVPHTVDLVVGHEPPDGYQVTGAFVLAVDAAGRLLLTRVGRPGRGWDVPGGHLEPGESAAGAAARELAEETGLSVTAGRLRPFGGLRIALRDRPPADHRYPRRSYLAFFALRLDVQGPRTCPAEDSECVEAAWLPAREVRELCAGAAWLALHEALTGEEPPV